VTPSPRLLTEQRVASLSHPLVYNTLATALLLLLLQGRDVIMYATKRRRRNVKS